MHDKCGRRVDSGQKLLMRCGQRAQIFCPRHLHCRRSKGDLTVENIATQFEEIVKTFEITNKRLFSVVG